MPQTFPITKKVFKLTTMNTGFSTTIQSWEKEFSFRIKFCIVIKHIQQVSSSNKTASSMLMNIMQFLPQNNDEHNVKLNI